MSEREIREAIRNVCADLELRNRAIVPKGVRAAVLPFVVGAGLMVAACSEETDTGSEPPYMAPGGYGTTSTTSSSSQGGAAGAAVGGGGIGGMAGAGGAGASAGSGSGADAGGQFDYMAPDP